MSSVTSPVTSMWLLVLVPGESASVSLGPHVFSLNAFELTGGGECPYHSLAKSVNPPLYFRSNPNPHYLKALRGIVSYNGRQMFSFFYAKKFRYIACFYDNSANIPTKTDQSDPHFV